MTVEDKKPVQRDTKPANMPRTEAEPPVVDLTRPVPVALVRFDRAIQYPGRQSDTHCKTERLSNGQTWSVEFISAHRLFKITWCDPARKVVKIGFVHESRAMSWEPV